MYGEEAPEPELEFPPIVPSMLEEHAFENLTTLQLTTSVCQLSEALRRWPAHVLSNLQRFDIDTSFFNVRLGDDLQELMQLIAARSPVLNAFSIGLLYSTTGHRDRTNRFGEWLIEQIQVDADLLRPLTALTRLTSLEIRANRSSCISVHDWPALLKFWPHLEVLVLDNTPRTYSVMGSGLKPGDAPLDQVLKTFHDYCPKLRVLSLHVDGTLALGNATPSLPVPTSLQALELVLPCLVPQDDISEDERTSESGRAETGPSDVSPAEQLPSNRVQTPSSEPMHLDMERMFIEDASRTDCLAEYLHAVLPPGCGLHVMDQGDFGLCDTLPGAKIEGEDNESQWHDVLYEWSVLHEVEGKQCRAQRCAEIRGDILVPVYVVPVRDSEA